jgi:hypothetical protein
MIFQVLWNITVPEIFGLMKIRYWQAFRLLSHGKYDFRRGQLCSFQQINFRCPQRRFQGGSMSHSINQEGKAKWFYNVWGSVVDKEIQANDEIRPLKKKSHQGNCNDNGFGARTSD